MLKVADEFIVIDSGSTDATLQICQQFGLTVHYHAYTTHGTQMNYATSLASHDWVLCMDSDEILDDEVAAAILALRRGMSPIQPAHGVCRATGSCWVKRCELFIRYPRQISRFVCITVLSPGSTSVR